MICQNIFMFVALLTIAAPVIEAKHPPKHHNNHHDHNPVPANLLDPELAPSAATKQLAQEEITEDNIGQHDMKVEVNEEPKKIFSLKSRQEETEDENEYDQVEETENKLKKKTLWVNCDYDTNPGISCYDCRTRLICKYPGGKLVGCNNALKPYCISGYCSSVASATCS